MAGLEGIISQFADGDRVRLDGEAVTVLSAAPACSTIAFHIYSGYGIDVKQHGMEDRAWLGGVGLREAAERLGVSQRRVRAMITAGQVEAHKVGGRWLVDPEFIDRVARVRRRDGPPWSPVLAWAYLLYRDGDPYALEGLSRVSRHRVRQRASVPLGLGELAALTASRAQVLRCRVHPSVVDEVLSAGLASGLSAAEALGVGLGVRLGEHADVYVPESRAHLLVDEFALSPARGGQVNAIVRTVPDPAWRLEHRRIAPALAVALDLAEHGDARSREAAELLASRAGEKADG